MFSPKKRRYFPSCLPTAACLLLIAFGFLSGCTPADTRPRLTVLTPGGEIRQAVDHAVERFRADHPGVGIEVVSTPSKNYYVKSLTMLAGRASVDLLWMGQGFGMFAERGALLDIGPYLANSGTPSPIREPVQDWYRFGGAVYGIPYGIDLQALACNERLLKQAGLSAPSDSWTTSDLLEYGRRLTQLPDRAKGERGVVGLGLTELPLFSVGLTLLDSKAQSFALDTPEGLMWLKLNNDLIWQERILRRGSDQESIDRLTGFLNEQVAITSVYTWDMTDLGQKALFPWRIVPVPHPIRLGSHPADGAVPEYLTWASSSGFSIARHTPHPDLAWQLLCYLTDETFQRDLLGRLIPASPRLLDDYIEWHAQRKVDVRPLASMLGHMQPVPRIRALNEVESEWEHWKELAFTRQLPPEQALQQARLNIDRILAQHREEAAR